MAALTPWLAYSGARKVDGTPVASGTVYFYQPGTTNTQVVVYSDADGLIAMTQPLTLDASGRGIAFSRLPCRIHIFDANGNLVRVEDRSNTVASGQVEVEVTGFTGTDLNTGVQTSGGRTDLATILGNAITSLGGVDFKVKPTGATSSLNLKDLTPFFTPQMFGALGDNNNDDTTAFQSAITAAISYGKKIKVPPGTYRLTSALTIASKGVVIEGENRDDVIIKNMSTSANVFTIDLLSAIDSKITIRDLSITASTTSSGAAVSVANGDRIRVENVAIALHRVGIDVSAVSGAIVKDCVIESTDDNTAAVGINLGARGRAHNCEIISGTVNGTGMKLTGADGRAGDCYITKFVTGVNVIGARGMLRNVHSTTATTGITLGSADSKADGCYVISATTGISATAASCNVVDSTVASSTTGISVTGATCRVRGNDVSGASTGYSVGAVASVMLRDNVGSSNTTDLAVNSSATLLQETGNVFSIYANSGASNFAPPWRTRINSFTSSSATPSFTPDITNGQTFQQVFLTGSSPTLTVGAHANTTYLTIGDLMHLNIIKTNSTSVTISWNTQFLGGIGSSTPSTTGPGQNQINSYIFRWDGTNWRVLSTIIQQTL